MSEAAIALAKKHQDHISTNYYTCTDEILSSLGTMYAGGGDFTTNIDKVGGEGTALFEQIRLGTNRIIIYKKKCM